MHQSIRTTITRSSLIIFVALAAACGSRDDSTAPTGNGSIVLTLTSRDGTTPAVTVTGPDGYSHSVSGTTTLEHLAAGTYTITADSIVTESTIVGYSVDTAAITGNPITITSTGSSAATITYAFARQHGALWVTNNSEAFLSGFARSQLLVSGAPTAADTLNLAIPNGVAFDADGNMWVDSYATDTIKMFTVAQRNSGIAATAPARVMVSSSLSSAEAMAFDSHGNLWVADNDTGLLQFSVAQLAAGGNAGPAAITLVDTIAAYESAYAVAFDAAGNAWVGEDAYNNVIEYTVAQLASSGSPIPNVRLGVVPNPAPRVVGGRNRSGHSARATRANAAIAFGVVRNLNNPDALAFDSNDNLWVGNYYGQNVTVYTPAQRATSGDPTPSLTLSIPFTDPYGLTFDKDGGLWVSDDNEFAVRGYTAAQIATSGAPVPNVLLTGSSIEDPQQMAFDEWVVTNTPLPEGSRVPYAPKVATSAVAARQSSHRP
jgi:hypothetical protein